MMFLAVIGKVNDHERKLMDDNWKINDFLWRILIDFMLTDVAIFHKIKKRLVYSFVGFCGRVRRERIKEGTEIPSKSFVCSVRKTLKGKGISLCQKFL